MDKNQTRWQTHRSCLPYLAWSLAVSEIYFFSIAYLLFFQMSQGNMKICKTYQNIIGTELQSRFELCSTSLQFSVSFDFIFNNSHNSFSPPLFGVHQEKIVLLQWVLNLTLSTFQTWHMKLFAQKYFQASFFNLNIIYLLLHSDFALKLCTNKYSTKCYILVFSSTPIISLVYLPEP